MVAMGVKQYATCTCPHCNKTFVAEVSFGSIELKTQAQDQTKEPVKLTV